MGEVDGEVSSDNREAARMGQDLMRQWRAIREQQDDRIRTTTFEVQAALERWKGNGPHLVEDELFVDGEVNRIIATITELNELGRSNNERIATLTTTFNEVKHVDADEQLVALVSLRDEIHHVMTQDLPLRSSVLDEHELRVARLESFIDYRLGPQIVTQQSRRFWRRWTHVPARP